MQALVDKTSKNEGHTQAYSVEKQKCKIHSILQVWAPVGRARDYLQRMRNKLNANLNKWLRYIYYSVEITWK